MIKVCLINDRSKAFTGLRAYDWAAGERTAAVELARKAAEKLRLPFVAVDVAQKQTGEWIVIECNDGQESGYAGCSPIKMWQNIVEIERVIDLAKHSGSRENFPPMM
ncbi:MAG: ATP-grasp domain-containing protein [Acidobacteria bacterium]|nr:ATP-grasp domain-containing protein [Acidobacteriota bacterium]